MADAAGTAPLSHHALRRRASCRGLECVPAREHGGVIFSLEPPGEEEGKAPRHHPAGGCFLCRRPLRAASDVFMYRGDTPFCSEECRQEQIELDEARERETMYRRRRHHHHHHREASVKRAPAASAQQDLYPRASDGIVAG